MRAAPLVLVLLAAPLAFAAPPAPAATTVTATNFQWTPASVTVLAGAPVSFVNGGGFHTWVADDGSASCNLPCTRSFAVGEHAYHCGVHPSMRGVVRVVADPFADVAVTQVTGATGDARRTTVTYVVTNLGILDTGPFRTGVASGAEAIATVEEASLAPGESRTVQVAWEDGALRLGRFPVRVTADVDRAVATDPDRANDARDGEASFVTPLLPGVAVPP